MADSLAQACASTRAAQALWGRKPVADRLRVIREFRRRVAANATVLGAAAGAVSCRPVAEKLVSEVLPLADSCRWLERRAGRVLAPRRYGKRGRPFWLQGVAFEVQRQPIGAVLIIGPGNYPLFLPAVQALHALVAGNAVWLKPAPGTRDVALAVARLLGESGLDPALLVVLPEGTEAVQEAIAAGVDKVVFTGSSENGRAVLASLAATNTPAIMELSGEDPVLVFADADLDLVVRALRFGSRLNNGNTCIAPRRLIVVESIANELLARLDAAGLSKMKPERVPDEPAALACANSGDFALGASIFARDIGKAQALAAQIKTGFVIINDLIVPTADPRMPFGGLKASGFGVTRGDEGLLEMTFPHVVALRKSRSHPHFDESGSKADEELFATYIRVAHGRPCFAAIRKLVIALLNKAKEKTV